MGTFNENNNILPTDGKSRDPLIQSIQQQYPNAGNDLLHGLFGNAQNNFQAQGADIHSGTNQGQIDQAYNQTQGGLQQQQAFLSALLAQNGVGNQSNVFGQQQALAGQLQQQANGQGPNPALQQLQNQTRQNVQQQAALMGSQRGAGANAGLIARQAAMQGANIQQQEAGQGALMQAQQQIAAQQALAQQQSSMAGLATNQVNQLGNAQNSYNQSALGSQQQLLNANAAYNSSAVNQQSNLNTIGADIGKQNAATNKGLIGGIMGGVGSLLGGGGGGSFFADGGQVDYMNSSPQEQAMQLAAPTTQAPSSPSPQHTAPKKSGGLSGILGLAAMLSDGGPVSNFGKCMKQGGGVPGKASVQGDSKKNDTVPAMLSPGEIVIPRSIANHPNAPAEAAKFVAAILAKKK